MHYLADTRPTITRMSIKCQSRCQSSVNLVLTEYQSRLSIDSQQRMPLNLVHMILQIYFPQVNI